MHRYTLSHRIWLSLILPLCLPLTSRKLVAEAFSTSHSLAYSSISVLASSSSDTTSSSIRAKRGTTLTRSSTDRSHLHKHSSALLLFQQQPSHSAILESIDEIFPPNLLDQRIALSRKDGYWPFISEGEDPPQEFVYGEFDVEFFCNALERARQIHPDPQTFCDLGSGTGRLVLVSAALYPWKLVRGIELLPGIHEQAVEKLESCRRHSNDGGGGSSSSTVSSGTSAHPSTTTPVNTNSQASSSIGGGAAEPVASGSELDDYWKQYKQFAVAPSPPSDDWLNQLSNSLDEEEEEEEDSETLTEGGLYIPNANANQEDQVQENTEDDEALSYSTNNDYTLGSQHQLPLAPIQLSCGSFDDPYEFFGDADVIFCFSSAMPYHIMIDMARAVGRQCKEGAIVLTTEYRLPEGGTIDPVENDPRVPHGDYQLELVEELNGTNEATGGESTVFIHRLTRSLVGTAAAEPLSRPKPNVSDMCYNAIQSLQENDPQRFLRQVTNQM
eukprot:CAMPEP_0113607860 /NCGR_PEP_ID=MMETSP0017_2-20120614/3612_1 /TAXON_ID=2856 /ORGANISM="Cylindrotheca closterium" /LENGTH=498 /DNA_ID=CAMNT_0000516497 /DNA_START=24 /DNA_END=1517 /DNA_ORIENTATION=- /assembly_acc=CAM_ASM_000147